MIDLAELARKLPEFRAELAKLRRHEEEARLRANNLQRIIEGIEGLTQGAGRPAATLQEAAERRNADLASMNGEGLRGIAAVRRVMLEAPERTWKAKDVHSELERRGWLSPGAQHPLRGTEAAINRLWRREEVTRVQPGRYRVSEKMTETATEE